MAVTLDGWIAREDGSFDDFPWNDDFGAHLLAHFPETFPAHLRGEATRAENRRFDAVLMGRRTYEVGLREGITSPYPTLDQYVFSRSMRASPDDAVTVVRDGAGDAVAALKRQSGRDICLCGGGDLAATLFGAGLVDRVILKLNPVVFGRGIPLVAGRVASPALEPVEPRSFPSGHWAPGVRRWRPRGLPRRLTVPGSTWRSCRAARPAADCTGTHTACRNPPSPFDAVVEAANQPESKGRRRCRSSCRS